MGRTKRWAKRYQCAHGKGSKNANQSCVIPTLMVCVTLGADMVVREEMPN